MTDQPNPATQLVPSAPPPQSGLRGASATKPLWIAPGGKQLTPELARALAIVGARYELDVALGEIMLVDTRAYITLEGFLTLAHRHPQFAGLETWPLTPDERKAAAIAADEIAYGCRVYRKDWKVPATGTGIASERGVANPRMKPYVRELAQARAIRRTLRLAFRVTLPEPEEGIDLTQVSEQIEAAKVPLLATPPEPTEEGVKPDYARFWATVRGWGMSLDDVHAALRVDSLKDWPFSLAEARDVCNVWVSYRRQAREHEADAWAQRQADEADHATAEPEAPSPEPTPSGETPPATTLADARRAWRALDEKADSLEVPRLPPMTNLGDYNLRHARYASHLAAAEEREQRRLAELGGDDQ